MFNRLWFDITHITKSSRHVYRHLDEGKNDTINPWGFIRVKNEISTLQDFLDSIDGVITRGVIAYHDCTDGSDQIIHNFCKTHKGFIPLEYKKNVIPVSDERYKEPYETWAGESLADYYNYAFSYIPVGDWFVKLDADHIFDSKKLEKLIKLPEHSYDKVLLDSLNCCYVNERIYCITPGTLRIVGDHWLMKKTKDLVFRMESGYNEHGFYAWESLRARGRRLITTDITNWHFPYHKASREHYLTSDNIETLSSWGTSAAAQYEYLPSEMVDEKYIYKFMKNTKSNQL